MQYGLSQRYAIYSVVVGVVTLECIRGCDLVALVRVCVCVSSARRVVRSVVCDLILENPFWITNRVYGSSTTSSSSVLEDDERQLADDSDDV